jgi:hypothetical protein
MIDHIAIAAGVAILLEHLPFVLDTIKLFTNCNIMSNVNIFCLNPGFVSAARRYQTD